VHVRPFVSLSFITLALGLVVLGATYAPFTDTDAESGDLTAGDIVLRLNTLKGVYEINWDGPGCVSDNMSPGDTCIEEVEVHNDGTVALYYDIVDLETPCFNVEHDPPIDTTLGDDGIDPGHLAPGETETIDIEVTLSDAEACNGASASVGIQVNASTEP